MKNFKKSFVVNLALATLAALSSCGPLDEKDKLEVLSVSLALCSRLEPSNSELILDKGTYVTADHQVTPVGPRGFPIIQTQYGLIEGPTVIKKPTLTYLNVFECPPEVTSEFKNYLGSKK